MGPGGLKWKQSQAAQDPPGASSMSQSRGMGTGQDANVSISWNELI